MIVKNESRIIKRCFDSLRTIVDYIVITDTGSVDNTVEIMNNYLLENNIEGEIYTEPWKNFGYNRTNSILNAKKYFKEREIDTNNIFILLVDADMIVEILDTSFKNSLHNFDHYLVEQYNPSISYYNTRIIRLNKEIKCVGVTHEYYDINSQSKTKNISIKINDIGDGGSKNDKFERDIKLLINGIDEEPQNVRYHFYLAESYKNCGKEDEAIYFYKKRIEFGGWFEEIYMSHLRLGDIYKNKNDWKNALYHYLQGLTESNNERGESLYEIASYYKNKGNNKTAYIFLKELLLLKYPKDHYLFIDYNVHGYKKYELLSIVSYYVDKIKVGLYTCQLLLLNNKYKFDNNIYNNIHHNSKFYINKLNKSNIFNLKNFQNIDKYHNSSSSIYYNKNGYYEGIIRTVNYSMNNTMNYTINTGDYINTENFYVKLNSDFNVIEQNKINLIEEIFEKINHKSSYIKGLEDSRYIEYKNEKYVLSISLEYGEYSCPSIVLYKLDDTYNINKLVIQKYNNNICQKNWCPIIYDGNLCYVYSYQPFILLKMNDETMLLEEYIKKDFSEHNFTNFRGSSNYILLDNNLNDNNLKNNNLNKTKYYLTIVHEVITDNPRKYVHRFLKFDDKLNLLDISIPFYFMDFFVEFVLSLDYNKDEDSLVIPFSVKDNNTYFCKLKINDIEWLGNNIEDKIELLL
jgi:hypothetical protein